MADFTLTVPVHAPAQAVWDVITNIADTPGVIPAITRIEMLTDGPFRVGTRWNETRRIGSREETITLEVVECDPPRTCTLRAVAAGIEYRTGFTLTPVPDGTTLALRAISRPINLAGRAMWLLSPIMTRVMKKLMRQDLDRIKAHVESASA